MADVKERKKKYSPRGCVTWHDILALHGTKWSVIYDATSPVRPSDRE